MNGFSNADDDDDDGSIGSNTFREIRRKAYEEEGETDEQLFNQHNTIQSLFDNKHHDVNFEDDLNSAGSSLGGYSDLGPGGGISRLNGETREDMRMSLIARRRRLAAMENAMAEEGSVDFSLRINKKKKGGLDSSSMVSSMRDSLISLGDSNKYSSKKSSKKKKGKDKKKKKLSSKEKERERRKEKERKKRKQKEKEKKRKKSNRRDYSSDESSTDSENSKSKSSSESSEDSRRKRRSKDKRKDKGGGESESKKSKAQVYYACDEDTGKCAFHSDVRLKRKSRDGRWKDVLKQCPKCVEEADKDNGKDGRSRRSGKESSSRRRKKNDSDSSESSSGSSAPKKKSSSSRRSGGKEVPSKSSSRRSEEGGSRRTSTREQPSRTSSGRGGGASSSRQRESRIPPTLNKGREFAESQATKKTIETIGTYGTHATGATKSTIKTGHVSNAPSSKNSSRHSSSRNNSSSGRNMTRQGSREIREVGAVDFDPPSKKKSGGGRYGGDDEVVIRDTGPKGGASYNIGDEGKRNDMIKDDDKAVAVKRISRLKSGDSAFIRRTTGNWTFAMVKSVSPESILFIVDEKGASKDYKKKYWGSHVRAAVDGIHHSKDAVRQHGGGRFSLDNLPR